MTKTTSPAPTQKPWLRPAVQKIAAGQAEAGQRQASSDGQFTFS